MIYRIDKADVAEVTRADLMVELLCNRSSLVQGGGCALHAVTCRHIQRAYPEASSAHSSLAAFLSKSLDPCCCDKAILLNRVTGVCVSVEVGRLYQMPWHEPRRGTKATWSLACIIRL